MNELEKVEDATFSIIVDDICWTNIWHILKDLPEDEALEILLPNKKE